MRFKNLDLLIAIVIVAINVVWTQVPHRFMLAGIIFALPLILFLPGYTLTQTLFRRQAPESDAGASNERSQRPDLKIGHPIGNTDQIVLSIGLSMAIDVLVGFALNILPMGLTALSWILSLGLLTTVCAIVATLLRGKGTDTASHKAGRIRITWQDCTLLGLAIMIVATAVWLSLLRPLQPQPSFTQFWMLPANQSSKTCAVSLGVQSFETAPETYRIVILVNNVQTKDWPVVVLTPQQKWVQSVPVAPESQSAASLYVDAQLYRVDKPATVYRDVHLTFYISSSNTNGTVQQQCVIGTQN